MRTLVCVAVFQALALAGSPPELRDLLRSTGQSVEVFWREFSTINCTETVSQAKLDAKGKSLQRQETIFDYLALTHLAADDLTVEESRVKVKSSGGKGGLPLLVTSGFSTLTLIFHPYFQGSYQYSPPEETILEGKKALRVDFEPVRNARSPSCLRLRGRDYPLEWRGAAWIDPGSGSIIRIAASLNSNMEDVGLKSLAAQVQYAPVRFSDLSGSVWLPVLASVEAETPRQHWRNLHRFTNYKRFSVSTTTTTQAPQ